MADPAPPTPSSSIQQAIDKHLDKKSLQPRTVIVLNELTGSFKLPKGVRIALRNCTDATCTSAEGQNELSFFGGGGHSVKGFTRGVLRFEQVGDMKQIIADNSTVTISGDTVQKLELTDCQTTIMDCDVENATFCGGETNSFKNKYEELELSEGTGTFYGQEDAPEKITVGKGMQAHFIKTDCDGEVNVTGGSIIVQDCEWNGEFSINTSNLIARKMTCQSLTITGEEAEDDAEPSEPIKSCTATFQDCEIKEDFKVTNGVVNIQDLEVKGDCDFTDSSIGAVKLKTKGLQVENCTIVLTKCEAEDEAEFKDSRTTLHECEFQDKITGENGSIQSFGGTYEDDFEFEKGTIDLEQDKIDGKIDFTELVGPNYIRNVECSDEINITGEESGYLLIEHLDGNPSKLEVSDFTKVDIRDADNSELIVENVACVSVDRTESQEATFTDCGLVLLNEGSIPDATFTDCGTVLASTCDISDITASGNHLLVTADLSGGTISDGTWIDTGSEGVTTDSANVIMNGSTVDSAESCSILNSGGTVTTASGNSVIVSQGGDVTNTDGLTVGSGFEADDQAGCVLQEDDLTVQCTTGDVNIKSTTGDVNVDAPAGDINLESL